MHFTDLGFGWLTDGDSAAGAAGAAGVRDKKVIGNSEMKVFPPFADRQTVLSRTMDPSRSELQI